MSNGTRGYTRTKRRTVTRPRRVEVQATTERPKKNVSPSGDVSLVYAYLDGDASAFDVLFSRYHARVRATCARIVSDEALAEDLVQETFYNVIRHLQRVDDAFNFGAWVHRIAVNLCQDELRRRNRRAPHHEPDTSDPEKQMLKVLDTDRHGNPEDALEMGHLRQLVWQVAKKLPERQRMVLTLRELQGLSYSSIAHVMGITDAAVETLLHRARRRFKEEYLLLESPREEPSQCAMVSYLLITVGRASLRAEQRKFIAEHLMTCDECQSQYLPEEEKLVPVGEPAAPGVVS